ncbi:MAG: hypothetical protein LBR70_05875 [Lactobacillaceae bacterium]|jgi:zinc transporter|nr:hypothetical protein [Lactobacillaceae bacterium]
MSEKHNTESFAIVLDGNGGIKETLDLDNINAEIQNLWVHLDYKDERAKDILLKLNLESIVTDALCTQTRHTKFYQNDSYTGTFLILRGMNPDSQPKSKDMTSLRIWIDSGKIVTLCHNYSHSIDSTIKKLQKDGPGPKNSVECFINISQTSFHNISNATYEIAEKVDRFEEKIIKGKNSYKLSTKIGFLRRQIITIHRYLLPQKDIFKNLPLSNMFSDNKYKNQFRSLYNDISRSLENLEYSREHIVILQEELENKVNISINNNMYILSVVVAIFTPLTLFSGMLGMNLEGIPFADSKYAFGAVSIAMLIVALVLFWMMRRRRII